MARIPTIGIRLKSKAFGTNSQKQAIFSYVIDWVVGDQALLDGEFGGWILQHVEYTTIIEIAPKRVQHIHSIYWEAWWTGLNGKLTNLEDQFQITRGSSQKGSATWKSKVYFVLNSDFTPHFSKWKPWANPMAGKLYSLPEGTDPTYFNLTPDKVKLGRSFSVQWDAGAVYKSARALTSPVFSDVNLLL